MPDRGFIGIVSFGTLPSCDRDTGIEEKPNVILIILDDLNYYGFGGHENMKLPYLDNLRVSSVVFSKPTVSHLFVCLPGLRFYRAYHHIVQGCT